MYVFVYVYIIRFSYNIYLFAYIYLLIIDNILNDIALVAFLFIIFIIIIIITDVVVIIIIIIIIRKCYFKYLSDTVSASLQRKILVKLWTLHSRQQFHW